MLNPSPVARLDGEGRIVYGDLVDGSVDGVTTSKEERRFSELLVH